MFGYTPKLHLNEKHYETVLPQGGTPQNLKDCYTSYINNRILCDALRKIDARILEMPESMIASWLRGVFDGDGYVRVSSSNPQIVFSAWNPAANQFIRDALLRVGIVTSVSPNSRSGKDGNICITDVAMMGQFLRKIGSAHPDKESKLDELWDIIGGRKSSARLDGIPAAGLIRSARASIGMGQRAFAKGHYVSAYERGRVTPISREPSIRGCRNG